MAQSASPFQHPTLPRICDIDSPLKLTIGIATCSPCSSLFFSASWTLLRPIFPLYLAWQAGETKLCVSLCPYLASTSRGELAPMQAQLQAPVALNWDPMSSQVTSKAGQVSTTSQHLLRPLSKGGGTPNPPVGTCVTVGGACSASARKVRAIFPGANGVHNQICRWTPPDWKEK